MLIFALIALIALLLPFAALAAIVMYLCQINPMVKDSIVTAIHYGFRTHNQRTR